LNRDVSSFVRQSPYSMAASEKAKNFALGTWIVNSTLDILLTDGSIDRNHTDKIVSTLHWLMDGFIVCKGGIL
jgi:hypothetical protein